MSDLTTFALVDELREVGTSCFSMPKLMSWLDLSTQALASAAHVHCNTVTYRPQSQRLQDFARSVVRVAATLHTLNPGADSQKLSFLLKNCPLQDFDGSTALGLVEAGRTDDAVAYLESFHSGFAG